MRCEKREIRDPRFRSVISYPDRTRVLEMFHLLDRARSGTTIRSRGVRLA